MSLKPLPGFRDFYPEQFAERAHIFETWRRVVRRYAFVEYDGPPLEPLELYTQKSGEEIVTQLYNFVDKGDRPVAMRPEMTPTFARMVGAKAQALRKPVRWFSLPQLFRYERTQKGRLREHYQLNVDLVGEADVLADAELLSVALEIMRAFGLTADDVRARVSDRRLLNGLLEHLAIAERGVGGEARRRWTVGGNRRGAAWLRLPRLRDGPRALRRCTGRSAARGTVRRVPRTL